MAICYVGGPAVGADFYASRAVRKDKGADDVLDKVNRRDFAASYVRHIR